MTERRRALAVTLALAALLQVVYTYTIPEREGPDEVEHLRYVEALAYRGALPHLAELPYDLRNAAGVRHNVVMKPTMLPPPHSHQAQHPPLVYAVYAGGLRLADSLGLPPRCLR
ncbi:MAG: hypothetical protein HUU35_16760, partial [Armatimonadetes bacterium]|nr:hypothetical protein [Armatimonadota bacterium]